MRMARDATAAIKHQLPISYEQVKVVVNDGWVTLEGEVGDLVAGLGLQKMRVGPFLEF
jgi:hypothetical protein